MRGALARAVEIERGMLEADFFKVLADDAPEAISVLNELQSYTKVHLALIEKEAGRLRWRLFG